ncbi:MAG: 1-(5-phosphoribosyl)-5-[(5-phosphoribosylamino)methylideneamino] imidazole-4-carboxamide isomerase [Acidimicrobiia bacterium]|nr:1-(5-phosphoribosyl)-5-[(5-phosphoribosylamino)methylideneamino] imidazole-4-carboxamide isomerase [Acidimicrobiia bacterium]
MQIIPAVDVLDGSVVRLRRGDYDDVTVYGDDPASAVAGWVDAGATLVHVVDLGAARTGASSPGLWERVGAAGAPFQAAGGIRTPETAADAVAAGASRVIVGTAAVRDPALVAEIVAAVGGARVVGAVDVRGGRARGAGWEDDGRPVDDVVDDLVTGGVGRLMVTGISRDGTMEGPDLDLQRRVAGRVAVPVIASGGVGTLDHVRILVPTGAEAVVVGRALYEGVFGLAEAIEAGSDAGSRVADDGPG